jgi:hypothetical protein
VARMKIRFLLCVSSFQHTFFFLCRLFLFFFPLLNTLASLALLHGWENTDRNGMGIGRK